MDVRALRMINAWAALGMEFAFRTESASLLGLDVDLKALTFVRTDTVLVTTPAMVTNARQIAAVNLTPATVIPWKLVKRTLLAPAEMSPSAAHALIIRSARTSSRSFGHLVIRVGDT